MVRMIPFEQTEARNASKSQLRSPSGSDYRASSRRGVLERLARVLAADSLAPSEIFHACCDAVAPVLDLVTVVLVEGFDGPPRSIVWKKSEVDWNESASAERDAWATFAARLAPELRGSFPATAQPSSKEPRAFRVLPLVAPLAGIVQASTHQPLVAPDLVLFEYMVTRLSLALSRYKQQWKRP